MLIVTRRINESIIIDTGKEKIEIVLKDVKGKNARIGIRADKQFAILRKELTRDDDAKEVE